MKISSPHNSRDDYYLVIQSEQNKNTKKIYSGGDDVKNRVKRKLNLLLLCSTGKKEEFT